jgi:hypothetical protein
MDIDQEALHFTKESLLAAAAFADQPTSQ